MRKPQKQKTWKPLGWWPRVTVKWKKQPALEILMLAIWISAASKMNFTLDWTSQILASSSLRFVVKLIFVKHQRPVMNSIILDRQSLQVTRQPGLSNNYTHCHITFTLIKYFRHFTDVCFLGYFFVLLYKLDLQAVTWSYLILFAWLQYKSSDIER